MKKFCNLKASLYMVMVTLMMTTVILAAGCMGSDKFGGDWIGNGVKQLVGGKEIVIYSVKKNGSGNGYVVTTKEIELSSKIKDSDDMAVYYCWLKPKEGSHPRSGSAKDNIIYLNDGMKDATITYMEADKTLQVDSDWSSIPHLKLTKVENGEKNLEKNIEDLKAKIIDEEKQEYEGEGYEVKVVSEDEWEQKEKEMRYKQSHQDYRNSPYYNPKAAF